MKSRLISKALEMGFADVKIVSAEPILAINYPHETDPQNLLHGTKCVAVLFWRYGPGIANPKEDEMAMSSYYICSNKAYHGAKELTQWLNDNGVEALHTSKMSARSLALRSGGFTAKNAQYVHPRFGTFVVIETVLIARELEIDAKEESRFEQICAGCHLCEKACPTVAICTQNFQTDCLRANITKNPIAMEMRGKIRQLLGCEICQTVCPYNAGTEGLSVPVYPVEDILTRKAIPEIQEIAGKNMARTNVLLAQAMSYAASRHIRLTDGVLEKLASEEALLGEMTAWAMEEEEK